jgi:hypothetical protein
LDDGSHRPTATELKHERDVFDDHPWNWSTRLLTLFEQTKHLADKTAPMTSDAGCLARLGQVLAWKASGDQFNVVRKAAELHNIRNQFGVRKPMLQDRLRRGKNVTKQFRVMTGPSKA